jgi:hypothetical protein
VKNRKKLYLMLLYFCLIGSSMYLGGTIILESIHSNKSLNGYIWVFIAVSIVHFLGMTESTNKKVEKKANTLLAVIFPLSIWLICYLNDGDYLIATSGIIIIMICFYVYHKIYTRFKP